MSPNDYNERFYQLVRRESFYAKRLSAMNEEICEAFLNISRFLIDEGYVSNNAREVDNIVEALPEQALANMFDDDTFATKFKIALKAVNPRLNENALSGEKRQAAAIALRLLEYSKNNATYLKPGAKAPKDPEGAAGEYNPKGAVKKPVGGSGAINSSLKGKVSQTEESDPILLSRQGKNPDGSSKMVGTPGPSAPGSKPKRPDPKNTNRPNSSVSSPGYDTRRIGGYDLTRLSNSFEPEGEMVHEDSAPIPNIPTPTPTEKPKDRRKPPTDGITHNPVPPGGSGDLSKPRDRTRLNDDGFPPEAYEKPKGGTPMPDDGTLPPNHDPNKYKKKGKPTPVSGSGGIPASVRRELEMSQFEPEGEQLDENPIEGIMNLFRARQAKKENPDNVTSSNKATREALKQLQQSFDPEGEMVDEDAKYDRNRKRAAQRAAARNAARDAGKTGVVPGVGYVSPRREKETYVDSAGVTRHKSGAKNEEVEHEVEEGYKPIDKKKENAMYRRAGNLARTSLSSKGKKKEEAQKKSSKIVSAITRQKEDERFERIGKDPKHQNNYKEDVEIQEEEGKKDACYKKVKARYDVWPSAYASGALVKCRQKGAANWGNKSEAFDIDALLDDPIFDQITEEELMHLAFDIFEEMEYEGILAESLEYFDDMFLSEEQDAGAVAKGRLERKRMGATAEGPEAGSREYKKKKVMGALKTAANAVKEKGSAAAGRASEVKKRAGEALKGAKDTAGRAVKALAKGGASLAKKAATKTAAAAGEVAGAAKGGFEAGRIKAKREAMSKTKPQAKPSSSGDGDTTKGKLDDLLKDVRGGGSKPASSGGSSGSSGGSSGSSGGSSGSSGGGRESAGTSDSGGTKTRKRGLLRRIGSAIKTGIKKVVGKTARGVSGVAGKVASRMGEDTEFDIILDYLLEHDVCSLDEAEEVMMELTEEEIENILTEREMTAADKAKEKSLKKKYDDSGMKASMKKQYGKEEGKKIYFATIRKQAMEETILEGDNLSYRDATEVLKGHSYSQKQLMNMSKKATNTGQHGLAQACYDAACAMKGV